MFAKKESAVISFQVQMLTYTKAAPGNFAVIFRRPNQTDITKALPATDSMMIIYNQTFHVRCNFVVTKNNEWKKKVLNVALVNQHDRKKNDEICKWTIDVSQLFCKDSIETSFACKNTALLGDVQLHIGVFRGEPPVQARSTDDSGLKKNTKIITAHRRTLSSMQQQTGQTVTSNFQLFSPSEELAEEISNIANNKLEKFDDGFPRATIKILSIIKDDLGSDIDQTKAVQQFLYATIKFNSGSFEEKLYSFLLSLHFYLGVKGKESFKDVEVSNLFDSFNQTFDFACLDLTAEYGERLTEQEDSESRIKKIDEVVEEIKFRVASVGSGRFYNYAVNGLLFAFATCFEKDVAERICQEFEIMDLALTANLNNLDNESGKVQDCSPVIEQITQYLTKFVI